MLHIMLRPNEDCIFLFHIQYYLRVTRETWHRNILALPYYYHTTSPSGLETRSLDFC